MKLLSDDTTDVAIVRPSGTGTATALGMSQDLADEIKEQEKAKLPFGFAVPPAKPKRKRKS